MVMIMMKWMITIAVITHMAWAEGYQYIFFEKKKKKTWFIQFIPI